MLNLTEPRRKDKLDMHKRCGKCLNCRQVLACRTLIWKALADADVRRIRGEHGYSVGEDVRLIWNQALRDYPCTGGPERQRLKHNERT